jgi:hypothetical protein
MIPSHTKSLRVTGLLGALILVSVIPLANAGPQEPLLSGTPPSSMVTDPVVGTINQEPVSAAEYRMIMERKTSLVYSYFKSEKGLDDHLGYWSETSGPTGPLAKLREMIRDELVRIKVVQSLAREKGLIADASFATLQNDYTRENARRRAALDAGEVVYGPKQYRSVGIYYYVRFGDLRYKLLEALAKEAAPGISDDDIKACYDERTAGPDAKLLDDELKQRIREALAGKQAEKQLEAFQAAARVELNADLLRGIIPRIDPAQDAVPPPSSS